MASYSVAKLQVGYISAFETSMSDKVVCVPMHILCGKEENTSLMVYWCPSIIFAEDVRASFPSHSFSQHSGFKKHACFDQSISDIVMIQSVLKTSSCAKTTPFFVGYQHR